ncbi:hypothetical protein [Mycolicibacterium fortuitum]|uniref:hypothetical protein n=1 Tax=Mycolicibacterium fortuitum TaxID=1766 RepID=UPI002616C6D3|nr:hypothetical protein [Mycolicibacterium fortuitum]
MQPRNAHAPGLPAATGAFIHSAAKRQRARVEHELAQQQGRQRYDRTRDDDTRRR